MYLSSARALAVVRIGFGLYFLSQVWDKVSRNWLVSEAPLKGFLFGNPAATPPTGGAVANATPFYADFLRGVVEPNAGLFSQLVTIGELTVGTLLILGLLTRLGAIIGMWLNLNYIFMKGLPSNGGSIDRLFFLAALIFLLAAAGQELGLDKMLGRQLARNPVTRWLSGQSAPSSIPAAERITA